MGGRRRGCVQDYNIRGMFNFGPMFGSSRANQGPSITDLLATPNVSLLRLLDEDTFLSEFRAAAPQVKEYMTYRKFSQLIELVTQVGDPFDKKRSYKFPLTAADLLASETPFVLEKLLPDEGVIVEEEKVVTSEERWVEQQVDEDSEDSEREVEDEDDDEDKVVDSAEKQVQQAVVKSEEEQQFGEFVVAPPPKKKIIKVKEVVEKVSINRKQYPALVAPILSYFASQMNYTLTSYSCKVLTSLLNKRTQKFLNKFFEDSNHTVNILKHIGSRSTVELLIRIITIENKEYLQERLTLFKEILRQASIPHELQAMSNISATLCESFQKLNAHLKTNAPCKQLQAYFNMIPELLASTVDNLISEHEVVSVYSAPFIFQLLNNLPSELDTSEIDQLLARFVKGAIRKLEQVVQERKNRLGVGRVKMLEILNFIFKRNSVKELLSQQTEFFALLISLIKAYPLNNILHNEAFKLVNAAITSDSQPLITNLISGDRLILWLVEEAEKEGQRGNSSPGKSPRGYAGHLVNLCKLIRDTNNQSINSFKTDQRFQDVLKVLVDKVVVSHERNLGGYAMRKNNKFQIMFTKEEILKQHATFLSNARPAVFQMDPDDPLQNPALLQELKRQLDGIEMNSPDKPEEVIEEEKHKAELIEENEQHKSAFWKVHLDYNVDDLINQML